jgi:heptosyltransferase-3
VNGASNPSVVLLFPGALGDLLLALPTLRALCARHAGVAVTLATNGWLVPIAAMTGAADRCASLDDAAAAGLFGGDAVPAWFGARPHVYAWIGRNDPATRARLEALAADVTFFTVERGDGPDHAAVGYAKQAGATASCAGLAATARIAPRRSEAAEAMLEELEAPVLAVHAGAGGRVKRWAAAGFAEVAGWWCGAGGDVVWLVGPADGDVAVPRGVRTVRDWRLADVAGLLAGVAAYVGNDSGVSHLAAAVGAHGVAIFGPTTARRWRPLGVGLVAVESPARDRSLGLAALPVVAVSEPLRQLRERLDKLGTRT